MKPIWKTALVDDEVRSLETLQWLLEEYCPQVRVAGAYSSPYEALQALRNDPPDLLILDIAMPGLNGFDLLHYLMPVTYPVVFITAHTGEVLRTLKSAKVPYLLKPIDDEELSALLPKVMSAGQLISEEQMERVRTGG